jgi:kinesin family member 1
VSLLFFLNLEGVEKQFSFDYSYNSFSDKNDPEYADQSGVYADLGVGILENAFDGYNVSLFAYGQTGSGKSYSMIGYGSEHGLIPNICEKMFNRIHDLSHDKDLTIKVTCSMMEIYMEKTRDLFNPGAGELKIRNDPKKGFFVEGLTTNAVADYSSISQARSKYICIY